jgi:hypothetical protein
LEETRKRIGSTYFEIKTDSKSALLYNVIYTSRRLLFVIIITAFEEAWVIQILLMIIHSSLIIIYLIYVKPYEAPILNKVEIFNEISICLASYHLIFFTDFTPDPQFQLNMGWSLIGITTLNIGVNMLVMIRATSLKVRWVFLKCRHTYRLK